MVTCPLNVQRDQIQAAGAAQGRAEQKVAHVVQRQHIDLLHHLGRSAYEQTFDVCRVRGQEIWVGERCAQCQAPAPEVGHSYGRR